MHEVGAAGGRSVEIGPGAYWTASADGSLVYFTNGDLYQYDTNTAQTTDITPGGEVQGVLGASEDGSYVYFVAKGVLAAGASAGEENLYLWHEGKTVFITTFTSGENRQTVADWKEGLIGHTSRVSPNGQYVAFQAIDPLTGYDNRPLHPEACTNISTGTTAFAFEENSSGRCVEVYLYSAAANRLVCASCDPGGVPPTGNASVPMAVHAGYFLRGWQTPSVQQRYLLDDGRLFFQSSDALVAQASNGRQNVYEYEPGGVGSCSSGASCVSLISTGTSSENSYFLDAGESGRDVFIITRQQLVAQDGDEALDVYDARVDGGFSTASPPPCSGEACRPAVTPAPEIYGAPPSATFTGPGNPPAQPATTAPAAKTKTVKKKKPKAKKRKQRSGKQRKRKARAGKQHGAGAKSSAEGRK